MERSIYAQNSISCRIKAEVCDDEESAAKIMEANTPLKLSDEKLKTLISKSGWFKYLTF